MVKKTKKQAFTIVELVIVIAVIVILAAIIIPTYSNLVKKANEATALVDAKNMITEMLADILSGDKDAADILVFSKKGNDVFLYGYDASRGVVLPYKVSPLKDFGKNLTVTDGHEFYKQAASFCKTIDGTDINEVTGNIDDWRKPEVLNLGVNGEKSTVEELGFDKNTMAVFANYDIVPESFAKKNSGGEEVHTHVWSTEWTTNSTHHWHNCTAEGCTVTVDSEKSGYGAHTFNDWTVVKPATETEKGSEKHGCSTCGYEESREIPVLTHTHSLTKVEAKAATCTEEGNKEYWHCSGCDKYFTDEAGTNETTLEALTISAKGHTYKYTDNGDGSTHKVTCEKCDLQGYSENHIFDADNKCTKCGYVNFVVNENAAILIYKQGLYNPITGALNDSAKPYKSADDLQTAIGLADDNDLILIKQEFTISECLLIEGKTIAFDLNGHKIKSEYNPTSWPYKSCSVMSITSSSQVTLYDSSSSGNGALIRTSAAKINPVIYLGQSTLNIYGVTIAGEIPSSGWSENSNANGINAGGSSTINFYSGVIEGNATPDNGGGIALGRGCKLNMSGGIIRNNIAAVKYRSGKHGGGVYVADGAEFTMTGGEISGNYVAKELKTADEVSKNTGFKGQGYNGGGAYVANGGIFTFNGGTIKSNLADIGSGVYVEKGGTYSKADAATISDNFSWSDSNEVYEES